LDETAGDPLAWQRELDESIANIDSRLKHPRRRVTGEPPAPPRTEAQGVTPEMIEQIAQRVAELLKHDGTSPVPAPPLPEPRGLPHGVAVTLRIRWPFFRLPWPFRRRRRRQAMITFSDYRIT
jgi:hypothetical protein